MPLPRAPRYSGYASAFGPFRIEFVPDQNFSTCETDSMMPRDVRMKNKRPVSKLRRYWWLPPVLLAVAFVFWVATGPEWSRPRNGNPTDHTLPPGYVTAFATVAQEYQRFDGKPLQDKNIGAQFDQATRHMTEHDYGLAAQMLE